MFSGPMRFGLALATLFLFSADSLAQQARAQVGAPAEGKADASAKAEPQGQEGPQSALDTATRFRRTFPTLPALVRGSDGLLNLEGQRATQNALVTSSNVKDPALDAFPLPGALALEAAEPVQMPAEQFSITLAKFYATVPVLDPINPREWHFQLGSPFFALRHVGDGVQGVRSATPQVSATGPLAGGRASLFQSFGYRLSRTTIEQLSGAKHDSEFQTYDLNNHIDINASRGHKLSARLALFSQGLHFATLSALVEPSATPDYLTRGGQLSFSDSYTSPGGVVLDSSINIRKLRVRVLPRGAQPMVLVEQGETFGNYFDTLRRDSNRLEWRETFRLPEVRAWGSHQFSFGGGLSRSRFESSRFGNTIILKSDEEEGEHEEEEHGEELAAEEEGEEHEETDRSVFSITNFIGSPLESQTTSEITGWLEDRWNPVRRVTITTGLKYDWTTLSRTNQWAPRVGFAVLPFKHARTVIRGGAGIFFDILPMTVGTFTSGRQRVIQFFDEGEEIGEPRVIRHLLANPHLKTAHVVAWNLEVNQEVAKSLVVRVKAEERRAKDLPLINPDRSGTLVTEFVLSSSGASRHREIETTAAFKPGTWASMNVSYIRSSSVGDLNIFTSTMGTFEKLAIGRNQHASSRSDAPNRFLLWGDVRMPGKVLVMPALDVHTGFPFGFTDADNRIPGRADFGRFPRTVSLDLGVSRDVEIRAFERPARLRLGLRVFNVTNHFNPRDVELGDIHTETEDRPIFKGFVNGAGRTYRAHVMLSF